MDIIDSFDLLQIEDLPEFELYETAQEYENLIKEQETKPETP